jgi:hypothetical protein
MMEKNRPMSDTNYPLPLIIFARRAAVPIVVGRSFFLAIPIPLQVDWDGSKKRKIIIELLIL